MPAPTLRNDSRYFPMRRGVSLFVVLAIAMVIWCCDLFRLTEVLDGPLYDLSLRTKSISPQDTSNVLLVYANRKSLEDPAKTKTLLNNIIGLGAKAVGFVDPVDEEIRRDVDTSEDIFFAAKIGQPNSNSNSGLVDLQIDRSGVYRNHYVARKIGLDTWTSLEYHLARHVGIQPDVGDGEVFGIHFRGAPGSLPHVDEQTVLRGELIPELVAGRIVLIGHMHESYSLGATTPTTSNGQQMSRLELHGHILHTLLTNRAIYRPKPIVSLSLCLFTALGVMLVYRKSSVRWTVAIFTCVMLATLGCGWAVMHWFSWWLPVTSLVAIQGCCCLFAIQGRLRFLSAATRELALQETVRQQSLKQRILRAEDPWSEIAELTNQLFQSSRMVFLELPAGEVYLRIVETIHCTEGDIHEPRRDTRRMPYSGAVDEARPLRLDERKFLKESHHIDETEVIVPLLFGGEVLGFIVIAMDRLEMAAQHDFEDRIHQLSREISGLVAECRGLHRDEKRRRSWLQRVATIPEEQSIDQLLHAEQMSQRQLTHLQSAFESTESAAAIYDAFGHMITVNTRMLQLLQTKGVVASEATSLELLSTLTGYSSDECRRLLRQAVIDRRKQSLILSGENSKSVLHICPIRAGSDAGQAELQIRAVYFELVEGAAFSEIHQWKDRISQQVCLTVDKQLDRLFQTTKELKLDGETAVEDLRLLSLMKNDIYDLKSTLSQSRTYLDQDISDDVKSTLPTDSLQILDGVVRPLEREANRRGIGFTNSFPSELSDALANPVLLQRVFRTILDVMLANAYDNSMIRVDAEDEYVQLTYRFQNEGYGTATQHLRQSLESGVGVADEFQRLKEVEQWLDVWGGRMTVTSQVGEGMSVELVLRCHHWVVDDPTSESAAQGRHKETNGEFDLL